MSINSVNGGPTGPDLPPKGRGRRSLAMQTSLKSEMHQYWADLNTAPKSILDFFQSANND
jgi:hypothetical protein